jgi:hypothetical protein
MGRTASRFTKIDRGVVDVDPGRNEVRMCLIYGVRQRVNELSPSSYA